MNDEGEKNDEEPGGREDKKIRKELRKGRKKESECGRDGKIEIRLAPYLIPSFYPSRLSPTSSVGSPYSSFYFFIFLNSSSPCSMSPFYQPLIVTFCSFPLSNTHVCLSVLNSFIHISSRNFLFFPFFSVSQPILHARF